MSTYNVIRVGRRNRCIARHACRPNEVERYIDQLLRHIAVAVRIPIQAGWRRVGLITEIDIQERPWLARIAWSVPRQLHLSLIDGILPSLVHYVTVLRCDVTQGNLSPNQGHVEIRDTNKRQEGTTFAIGITAVKDHAACLRAALLRQIVAVRLNRKAISVTLPFRRELIALRCRSIGLRPGSARYGYRVVGKHAVLTLGEVHDEIVLRIKGEVAYCRNLKLRVRTCLNR